MLENSKIAARIPAQDLQRARSFYAEKTVNGIAEVRDSEGNLFGKGAWFRDNEGNILGINRPTDR